MLGSKGIPSFLVICCILKLFEQPKPKKSTSLFTISEEISKLKQTIKWDIENHILLQTVKSHWPLHLRTQAEQWNNDKFSLLTFLLVCLVSRLFDYASMTSFFEIGSLNTGCINKWPSISGSSYLHLLSAGMYYLITSLCDTGNLTKLCLLSKYFTNWLIPLVLTQLYKDKKQPSNLIKNDRLAKREYSIRPS